MLMYMSTDRERCEAQLRVGGTWVHPLRRPLSMRTRRARDKGEETKFDGKQ